MANELDSESLDNLMASLETGLSTTERLKINTKAAAAFKTVMLSDDRIPKSAHVYGGGTVHLRSAFIMHINAPNGYVEDGFSKESKKAYIGRFLNDGWTVKDRNKQTHSHVAGLHFWELTRLESESAVKKIMINGVKGAIDKKVKR
ncbi:MULTISPECIES: phage tail protein [Lactiplantibacillus]|uniref:Phage tail protein n=1 Tax=Lactiplantibacillus pentosus TaxID=1589 RepID=A0AAW8WH46_LACPE|nr:MULTISPECIES: phage tail protein [Lactiplantibacillus]MBU7461196.1 phage tail protein [Lactiplantibacillus pentosus]MBU7476962.1 phage tail protein [Lactiplantibacillus pentosus]MBU7483886.1 phage tail protein [Lactiplantibacillus sp. 30.2.29]MBU7487095.1 phage tail protein [Lactiplantibacillus pentosus]MBU7500208.1 phage tail protein [Lactiplantibacillus pentosus]